MHTNCTWNYKNIFTDVPQCSCNQKQRPFYQKGLYLGLCKIQKEQIPLRVQSPLNKKLPGLLVSPRHARGFPPSGAGKTVTWKSAWLASLELQVRSPAPARTPRPWGRGDCEICSLEAGAFGPAGTRYCLWCQPGSSAELVQVLNLRWPKRRDSSGEEQGRGDKYRLKHELITQQ